MKKQSIPNIITKSLEATINYVVSNKDAYVKKPGADFTRERKLPFGTMLFALLSMGANSLKKELFEFSENLNINVTSSAFIQQRKKIKSDVFRVIFQRFNAAVYKKKTFRGYRLLAADGSDINMPRTPGTPTFITHSKHPRGYNQYHLNALYDLQNRVYFDAELQPRPQENERAALINMLHRNKFDEKTIVIVDRGYESYNMLANFIETTGVDFVARVKNSGRGALAEIEKMPMKELDKDIAFGVTTTQTNDDKLHNRRFIQTGSKKGKINSPKTVVSRWDYSSPYTLKFRVVRFLLENGTYETIATSLPREKFSIADIKELYRMRWGIETSFRELKYFVGLIALHGKSEEFVAQEIFAALIMYNYCEYITGEVVINNSAKNTHIYQVNYSMAFFLCRNYFKKRQTNGDKLSEDIGRYVEPVRPGRKDKRKLRPKAFIGFLYRIAA